MENQEEGARKQGTFFLFAGKYGQTSPFNGTIKGRYGRGESMQNPLLLKFVLLFIGCTVLKIICNMFLTGIVAMVLGVLIDAAFLGSIYVLLRNYRIQNLKKIMGILVFMTVISTLTEFGVLSGGVSNLVFLAVLAWLIFGKDGIFRRRRKF